MDQFVCDTCGNVDNIDLAYSKNPTPKPGESWRCTKCQTGKWHGMFPEGQYNPEQDLVVNRPNGVGLG